MKAKQLNESAKIVIDEAFLKKRPLSYSSLKEFRKSPRHYYEYITKPRTPPSDVMIIGNAVEALALPPYKLNNKFIVYKDFKKQSGAAKEKWKDLLGRAKEEKKMLLSLNQLELAKICKNELFSNLKSKIFFENVKDTQVKLQWVDPATKLPLIGYVDFTANVWETNVKIDLKTSFDTEPGKFNRNAYNLKYYLQAGCYLEGYKRTRFEFPEFLFITSETTSPFNVSVMYCDHRFKKTAQDEFTGLLQAFKYCLNHQQY